MTKYLNFIILILSFNLFTCKSKTSTIEAKNDFGDSISTISAAHNQPKLKTSLIDSLYKYEKLDSCEFIYENNSILKIGHFLNNSHKYALISIPNKELMLFENLNNKWELIEELVDSNHVYRGFELNDINGDNNIDLLFPSFSIYSNYIYYVFIQNSKTQTLDYYPDFDGIFNPTFDKKTKLINSFLETNHGDQTKSTYKFEGKSLKTTQSIVLKGTGIEDIDKNEFYIEEYSSLKDSLVLKKSTRFNNYKNAFYMFDKMLFVTEK